MSCKEKKNNKKMQLKNKLQNFTVKIECLVPATIVCNVQAETTEQAIKMAEANLQGKLEVHHAKKKIKQRLKCYRRGTSMMLYSKQY